MFKQVVLEIMLIKLVINNYQIKDSNFLIVSSIKIVLIQILQIYVIPYIKSCPYLAKEDMDLGLWWI